VSVNDLYLVCQEKPVLDISYKTPVYFLHQNKIIESTEQEEYSAAQECREPGQVQTGIRVVEEWTWELEKNALLNRVSNAQSECPPLSRIGHHSVSGKEGLPVYLVD
jgi:hypothetical protein